MSIRPDRRLQTGCKQGNLKEVEAVREEQVFQLVFEQRFYESFSYLMKSV